ncbi:uncharacterized protein LOC126550149 [Aphis gossypii]|uniref:uncharacterized protein LOC126550149 n=1 Tax=Aphis gossypii TaxID=80765 RepID=UPI002159B5DB|nr:uncharacterized protein LOC126550149 [Aphis gossypii]
MTENDREPQSVSVTGTDTVNISTISTIIIVVFMTVIFLCTYYTSSWSAVEIKESTIVKLRTNHFGNDGNSIYAKSTTTDVDLGKSETSASLHKQRIVPIEAVSDLVSDQRSSTFRLAKHSWISDSEYESRVWSPVVWSKLTAHKTDPHFEENNQEEVTNRPVELWDINSRSNRHNRWNTNSNEWAGHHTSYDLTYGLDHNDALKHADANTIGEIGFGPHYSSDNGAYYGSMAESPLTTHYQPPLRTLPIYPVLSSQIKQSILKNKKFDWHTVGLLTLVKVGLIKLKLFGILKILFFLLFKFKLFLMALFIKFHLVLKLSKVFKTFFVLLLFPILTTLILTIILSAAMYLVPEQSLNMMPESPAAPSPISNLLSSLLSNLPGIPARPGSTKSVTSDKLTNIPKSILASRSNTFRFNDRSFSNKRYADPLATVNPILNIF